jgi:hypothetical protein
MVGYNVLPPLILQVIHTCMAKPRPILQVMLMGRRSLFMRGTSARSYATTVASTPKVLAKLMEEAGTCRHVTSVLLILIGTLCCHAVSS